MVASSLKSTCRKWKWLLLLPVVYGILQVAIFGVNVVFWDEWEVVRLFDDIQNHGLTFAKLFAQHNEHRIFFPRIVLLLSGVLTHWNVKVDMYITQAMVSAMYFVYLRYYKSSRDGAQKNQTMTWGEVFFCLTLGLCCFSPVQWENFLWGFQVGFVMVAFAAVMSFYSYYCYLQTNKAKYLVSTLLWGIVASFSSLQGLAIWIVYVVMFFALLIAKEKNHKKSLGVIVLVGAGSIALYMNGFHTVAAVPSIVGNSLIDIINYFLTVIGSIVFPVEYHIAMLFGTVILLIAMILFVWTIRQHRVEENYFSLCLVLLGFAICGMISIGRVGFGIEQALHTSRYTTFAMMSFVGMLLIIDREFLRRGVVSSALFGRAICAGMAIITLGTVGMGTALLYRCENEKTSRQRMANVLTNYDSNPLSELSVFYPWANYQDAYRTISILEKNNLSVFQYPRYSYSKVPSNVLDGRQKIQSDQPVGIDQNTWVSDDLYLSLQSPWIADFYLGKPYQTVYVRINGTLFQTANHISRPDVAEAFGNRNFKDTGFAFSIPLNQLADGENQCSVVMLLADGVSYYETDSFALYKSSETGTVSTVDLDAVLKAGASVTIKGIEFSLDVKDIVEYDSGFSLVTSEATDPQIVFAPLETPVYPQVLKIEFAEISSTEELQLFYTGKGEGFSEEKSIRFTITPEQNTYYLSGFKGNNLQQLRLDLSNKANVSYHIEKVELYYAQ